MLISVSNHSNQYQSQQSVSITVHPFQSQCIHFNHSASISITVHPISCLKNLIYINHTLYNDIIYYYLLIQMPLVKNKPTPVPQNKSMNAPDNGEVIDGLKKIEDDDTMYVGKMKEFTNTSPLQVRPLYSDLLYSDLIRDGLQFTKNQRER